MSAPLTTIWVEAPEIFDGMGFWQERKSAGLIQYVRADHADLLADVARREGYELARRQAAESGTHLVRYDVARARDV